MKTLVHSTALGFGLACLLGACTGMAAEPDTSETEKLKSEMREMRQIIDALKKEVEELKRSKDASTPAPSAAPAQATVPPATTAPVASTAPSATVDAKSKPVPEKTGLSEQQSRLRHRETVLGDNQAAPRPGNAPIDPEYQGFMPIFGTTTWVKLGGYAKVDAIVDSTKVGNPNKFVTATIPVEGEANYGKPEEFNLHAKQTRVNLELRSPTPLGSLRIYYENDFFGNSASAGMTYNLRHFYGQVANFTVGQTWTAFLDPDVIPDTLDFAGPGIQAIVRQPQIRYTFSPVREHIHFAISMEEPSSDLTFDPAIMPTSTTRNVMPDLAGHMRVESDRGHLQLGGLMRVLAFDNSAGNDDSALAWAFNLAGIIHTVDKDGIVANFTYGQGLGRYAQDLPGGSSAVADAAGNLHLLTAWGGFVGYRHFWSDNWRSEATYGYLQLDNRPELGAKAYDHTHYIQGNLIWTPFPRLNVGLEYLFGIKEARDGTDGCAHRGQFSVQYKLL